MNKIKKLKLKLSAARLMMFLGVLFVAFAVVGVVVSYQSNEASKVVNENGVVNFYEAPAPSDLATPAPIIQEDFLGASASDIIGGNLKCQNGDCTYYLSQDWTTNTTTLKGDLLIASFPNPFLTSTSTDTPNSPLLKGSTAFGYVGATSTVESVRVSWDGANVAASTTFKVLCSASTDGFTTSSYKILESDVAVPTSTWSGVIESGMASTTVATQGFGSYVYKAGSTNVDSIEVKKIQLTPVHPYLVCVVSQPYNTGLDTFYEANTGSTTSRAVNVRVSRQQL